MAQQSSQIIYFVVLCPTEENFGKLKLIFKFFYWIIYEGIEILLKKKTHNLIGSPCTILSTWAEESLWSGLTVSIFAKSWRHF